MPTLKIALIATAVSIVAGLALVLGVFFYYTRDLPSLSSLADYHPRQITRVYSDDGELIAQYYIERRTVVPRSEVPDIVVKAFLAAEDANFYQHEGINYGGITRALIKGILHGGHFTQGGSTITQQLVKTLITGPERTVRRKVREAVLTKRVEETLTKDDILQLYLNQIVFGRGNYGVEEASQAYFGKHVRDLSLAEAAILGGIPKNPEKYNPLGDLKAVKDRQKYVLGQMVEKNFVTQTEADQALAQPIATVKAQYPYLGKAPHYAEVVRRQLEAKLGAEKLYGGGLTIYTAADAKLQLEAHIAMRLGLRELDRRQGYRGPIVRLEPDEFVRAEPVLAEVYKDKREAWVAYRGAPARGQNSSVTGDPLVWDLAGAKKTDLDRAERLHEHLQVKVLSEGDELTVPVVATDNATVTVRLGDVDAVMSLKDMAWARKWNPTQRTPAPRSPSDVCRKGDVIMVRVDHIERSKDKSVSKVLVTLTQDPRAEGAFVAIDPHSHFVRALVGGDSLESTGLIRATQSKRQPGSSFKAVIYAAAMASRELTPATMCSDTPIVMRDPWTGEAWKPRNFEADEFDGDIILNTALAKSKNTCSVKVLEKAGVDAAVNMAKQLGINEDLPKNLTLALGTGEVTPLEMTNAYATLASGGYYAAPIFVRKIKDNQGNIVELKTEDTDGFGVGDAEEGESRIDEDVAYVMTHMLRAVVEEGTGIAARALHKSLVGKTGTSSDSRDAWFIGYTPDIVAGTWVGFDDNQPLGPETGAKAALPVWIRAMKRTLAEHPDSEWEVPEGVNVVSIDRKTGLLASPNAAGAVDLAFLAGTEPQESASQATGKDFFDADEPDDKAAPPP